MQASATEPRPRAHPELRGVPRWIYEPLALVAGLRLAFFMFAYATQASLADQLLGFFDLWNRWDAGHFLRIADVGYSGPEAFPYATAFFPAYPLAIRGLAALGLPALGAALTLSFAGSVVACCFLYRLAEEDVGPGAGRRAVLYLLLFPTSVFLVAPYSEGLFLAGAVPAFYYARRARPLASGAWATLATGTRAAGIFLVAGLALEHLRARPKALKAVAGLALACVPIAAYALFLTLAKDDPFRFLTDQRLGWYREFTSPLSALRTTLDTWSSDFPFNWKIAFRIEVVAAAAGLAFTAWAALRKEWGYALFMALTMAALMTSTWYMSIPRILLSLFPITILLARYTRERPRRHELLLVLIAPLSLAGVVVFTGGQWFF
jgi:hypothetical protein